MDRPTDDLMVLKVMLRGGGTLWTYIPADKAEEITRSFMTGLVQPYQPTPAHHAIVVGDAKCSRSLAVRSEEVAGFECHAPAKGQADANALYIEYLKTSNETQAMMQKHLKECDHGEDWREGGAE